MRQKRAKQYRKQMLVYKHTFKFREPYQVIVDEQIVQVCEQSSYDLKKGLERTIQAEVRPMITQCCMEELYKTKNQKLIEYGKSFERRRCNHPPAKQVPSHECIKSIVIVDGENKHRYVVASENEQLRWSLRKIPGIPLIYMNRAVMVMEPLSKASAQASRTLERGKLSKGLNDVKVGFKNPVMDEDEKEVAEKVVKKRKGPKEPNPLSIKKKKTSNEGDNNNNKNDSGEKKKRKRKHKKHGASTNEDEENDGNTTKEESNDSKTQQDGDEDSS